MQSFTNPEDFASDPSFQRWVLTDDSVARQQWQRWLTEHPDQRAVVKEARQLVLALHFTEDAPRTGSKHEVWQRIQAKNQQPGRTTTPIHRFNPRPFYWKVAAAIALLFVTTILLWTFSSSNHEVYTTSYGEVTQIVLPDGSRVTLNANSSLHYPTDWEKNSSRQVWLEGEAFFTVTKQKNVNDTSSFAKFTVHTDDLAVEVLGTAFNVNTRREATQVVLEHGKVKVIPEADATTAMIMQPGEVIEYRSNDQSVLYKAIDIPVFTSWKEGELVFQDQTLREIADRLEDTYGYQITFEDSIISQKKFTVSIPAEDVELLFPMLARSFSLHLEKNEDQITYSYQKLN